MANAKVVLPLVVAALVGAAVGARLFGTAAGQGAPAASASSSPAAPRAAGLAFGEVPAAPVRPASASPAPFGAAFEAALALPAGPARTQALVQALAALAEQQPALALEAIRRHPQLDVNGVLSAAVLPALIRKDLALAAETVAAMGARAPVALIQQVAAAYARSDPATAYAWLARVAQGRTDLPPARLVDAVSSSLVASDADAAAHFMGQTPDAGVRKSLMNEIAIRKGQDDLGAAWNWLAQYSSDPAHGEAVQNLLYRWSYTKPEEVARLLPQVTEPDVQAEAAAHLTRFWQQKDPQGYQKWLASLPPGALRNVALAAR
ncbi:MAG: hypothetical protein ACLGI6_13945 [Gammaproteobacteria bacterium]